MKNRYVLYFLLILIFSLQGISKESLMFKIAGRYYSFSLQESLLVNKVCSNKCIAQERTLSIKKFKIKKFLYGQNKE